MNSLEKLTWLKSELHSEITDNILPYWSENTMDKKNGGFVGRITHNNKPDYKENKGAVLNTRLLWAFSAGYEFTGQPEIKDRAYRAFEYLKDKFWDPEFGGIYWELDFKGNPLNTKKYMYAQSFALYGFSEFYIAFKEEKALDYAKKIFFLIEDNGWDSVFTGYNEVFSRDWVRLEDARLSSKDQKEPKSTNVHLHILESYTSLYRIWESKKIRKRLINLIEIFDEHILHPKGRSLNTFMSVDWESKTKSISYGHDIEAGWLLRRAAQELDDATIKSKALAIANSLYEGVIQNGIDQEMGGLLNMKRMDGTIDTVKYWWPQAEAIVGFMDAYEMTKDEKYLNAAIDIWHFIKENMIDYDFGEWYECVKETNEKCISDKVNFWKGPYHNSRAAIEIVQRTDKMLEQKNIARHK